ncbi:O-methyltransferase [Patulibacter minatonensis]|uniref:O-methyltransferase n=1 Tax=Patulibacter minatonensis TaxID=298163 RepID=UPI00068500F4|nr:class I SAM-dependent methyltransferase [Patulibacter minatonensis]
MAPETEATTGAPRPVTPVGILAAELEALVARVTAEGPPDAELLAGLVRARDLAAGLDPYVAACTSPESPALAALHRRTAAEDWGTHDGGLGLEQEMVSGHVEGQVLRFLVHATGARRVLEVGLFTGYSALAMAEALPDDGELVACEVDPRAAAIAEECLGASAAGAKVRIELAPALETLGRLADAGERFDLVFVDADKAGYAGYLDAVLDRGLLSPDGVVAVDNTLLQGQPYLPGEPTPNGAAIRDFNAAVAADPRVEQVLLPVRDGLTLIRRAA